MGFNLLVECHIVLDASMALREVCVFVCVCAHRWPWAVHVAVRPSQAHDTAEGLQHRCLRLLLDETCFVHALLFSRAGLRRLRGLTGRLFILTPSQITRIGTNTSRSCEQQFSDVVASAVGTFECVGRVVSI